MPVPSPVYLYRIIHISNLPYILKLGKITTSVHPDADPNYEGIGDKTLIQSRSGKRIILPPGGTFTDYVSFYFGQRSPMLYNIRFGFMDVKKCPQEEIIYLVTTMEEIEKENLPYVFFDGHGYHNFSEIYNKRSDLKQIDWKTAKAIQWNDTAEDTDRKRRKQAEFLVHREVPLTSILGIAVYNEKSRIAVEEMIEKSKKKIKVIVKNNWYY